MFDSAESKPPGGSGTGGFVIRDKLKPGDLGGLIQLYGLIIYQKFGAAEPLEYEFAKILTNFALGKEPEKKFGCWSKKGKSKIQSLCFGRLEKMRKSNIFFCIMINEEGNLSISY